MTSSLTQIKALYSLPRGFKRTIFVVSDVLLIATSIWLSLATRVGEILPTERLVSAWYLFFSIPLILVLFYWHKELYSNLTRQMTGKGFKTIVIGVLIATVIMALLSNIFQPLIWPAAIKVPRSLPFIFFLFTVSLVAGLRIFVQWLYFWLEELAVSQTSALIYGAGSTGVMLSMILRSSPEYKLIGFIDDDNIMAGTIVRGLPVHHSQDISRIVSIHRPKQILLAVPTISTQKKREIYQLFESYDISVRSVPSVFELVSGKAKIDQLVDVKDILKRTEVDFELKAEDKFFPDKVVLVTGAGGSIGSELSRQITTGSPEKLILLDHSELALFNINKELQSLSTKLAISIDIIPILGSVCDRDLLESILKSYKPQMVFHAAAYKHVALVEKNPIEAINNNVFGTHNLANLCSQFDIERFILVSTDKAVRPTSVMGASKRLAELCCQTIQTEQSSSTIFSMVRFGNVLGSSGSVLPIFSEQIRKGGPVTVTDPKVTRFFMTIPEAASLVITAGMMAKGGELYILDMGEPVRILDMAHNLIRLSGYQVKDENHPYGDIEIQFTGLTKGEKLNEELLICGSAAITSHPKIMSAQEPKIEYDEFQKILEALKTAALQKNTAAALSELFNAVAIEAND